MSLGCFESSNMYQLFKPVSVMLKQNFQEQPLRLLSIDQEGVYHLVPETLAMIASISHPLAIVSIGGQYRTGKSYLLNRVVLNRSEGFQVGSTINSCTKGLWVWGKPLIGKTAKGELINILVVDCEGFGSTEEEVNYDTKLFALNMLITSCFLFNSVGAIDEGSIQSLALVAEIIKGIKESTDTELESPQLLWILRDFSLQLVSDEGESLTPSQYLDKSLELTKEESRNKIRRLLLSTFPDRDCIPLVRPITSEQDLSQLRKVEFEHLRPEFIEQAISVRRKLLNSVKPKKYFNKEVDGVLFCRLLSNYTKAINSNEVPKIQHLWRYVSQESCQEAVSYFEEELEMLITEKITHRLPINDDQLAKILESIEEILLEELQQKISNYESSQGYVQSCRSLVSKRFLEVQVLNQSKIKHEIQKNMNMEYVLIEKKISTLEVDSIEDVIIEFQKTNESLAKRVNGRSNKVEGLINTIAMGKIVEASKLVMGFKSKQIESLKYQIKEEELKYQKEIREIRNDLQSARSTSIMEINRLETDRKQLEMREQTLQELISELKTEKSRIEESMETESRREKSVSVRTVSEMRFKLDQYTDKHEENERRIYLVTSEHQKTEALMQQRIEFQNKMVEELRQKLEKSVEKGRAVKSQKDAEIKELTKSLEEANKAMLIQSTGFGDRILDFESEVQALKDQVEEAHEKYNKLASEKCHKEDEYKSMINKLELRLKDKEMGKAASEKQAEEAARNNERISSVELSLSEKEDVCKQLRNELRMVEAVVAQKTEFYEMEMGELTRKYEAEASKNSSLLSLIGAKEQILIRDLKEKHDQSLRRAEEEYTFEVSHLRTELEEALAKKHQLEEDFSSKKTEFTEQLQILHSRNKDLEEAKSKLAETNKTMEGERIRQLRQLEQTSQETIRTLSGESERLKTQNRQEMSEMKEKNLEMMRHLKNYYEMEKEKYEKRLLEMQGRYKEIPIEELEAKVMDLESKNIDLEEELLTLKQELSEAETRSNLSSKQSEIRVSELQRHLNLIKEDRHSSIQQNSKERTKREESYGEQLDMLRLNLLNSQNKLDVCYSDLSKKEKELSVVTMRKDLLETQGLKKEQVIEDLKGQLEEDASEYQMQLREMTEKYHRVSEESLKYKIEAEKELALTHQEAHFSNRKILELQDEKTALEEKASTVKEQHQAQLQQTAHKYGVQLEAKNQQVDKMRKGTREEESRVMKVINGLEKDKIGLQEQLRLAEIKLQGLAGEYNRYKQEHSPQVGDQEELFSQIKSLKSSLKEARQKYDIQHSKLLQLQSTSDRDKLLSLNKFKFLETQRDQAKQDLSENFKKFEQALSQLSKSRSTDESLEDISRAMERKYSLQIENLKQSYDKKLLESDSTIKLLNVDIRKLKEEFNREKEQHRAKLEEELQLISMANNTLSEELSKEQQEKEYSHEQIKRELLEKIERSERSNKEAAMRNNQLILGVEKEQVKWNIERKALGDTVQELSASNEQLFRENQRLKNKEKLISKKFIRPD